MKHFAQLSYLLQTSVPEFDCLPINLTLSYIDMIQDRVPAFSPKKARDFIERELGAPIDVLFKEFEERPIAAASLGQVFDLCLCISNLAVKIFCNVDLIICSSS